MYTFSPDLLTGNATIDEQHKALVIAINNLLDACKAGAGRQKLPQTMKFLHDYTIKHFADEEALQAKYKYPDFSNHKGYHRFFVAKVKELETQLIAEGPSVVLVGKINTALASWLFEHIKQQDKKVAEHIKSATQ